MGPSQLIVSGVMSILAYAVLVVAVFKIFAISTELTEVKELLKDIQRNTQDKSPEAFNARIPSPASLVRAVNSASYSDAGVEDTTEVGKP